MCPLRSPVCFLPGGLREPQANLSLAYPASQASVESHPDSEIFRSSGPLPDTSGNPAPVDGCSLTEICTLYVQPRHHGRGLGKGLLAEAFSHLSGKGAESVWLTINSENTPAIGFYLAQGFRCVGQTVFEIDDQAYPNEVFSFTLGGGRW